MIVFFAGLVVGAVLGVVLTCLLVMAREPVERGGD